jgi:hypothetical protein
MTHIDNERGRLIRHWSNTMFSTLSFQQWKALDRADHIVLYAKKNPNCLKQIEAAFMNTTLAL